MLLQKTPDHFFDDNQFKEYLWSCFDIKRSLLLESLRSDSQKEIVILKALFSEKEKILSNLLEQLQIREDSILPSIKKDAERYQRFLLQLLHGNKARRRFKVFFIGENQSGKNTLLKAISNQVIQIPMKTTSKFSEIFNQYSFLKVAYWNSNNVDFILWNLKGSLCPNIDIFMESKVSAGYFIIINLLKPLKYDYISKLLNIIQVQHSMQSVFFIGTHIDVLFQDSDNSYENFDILLKISKELQAIIRSWYLSSKSNYNVEIIYPDNGLSFFPVDYRENRDFNVLKQKLLAIGIRESKSLLIPLGYANLFYTLQKYQISKYSIVISWKQFEEWGKMFNIVQDDLRDAAIFFHNSGELVYFDDCNSMEDEYLIAHPIVSTFP